MAKAKLRQADLMAAVSPTDVRAAVKALRVALGLGQEGLARQLSVALRTVARWETPGETLPASTLNRLRLFALNAGAIDAVEVFDAEIKKAELNHDLFYGGNIGGAERQYTPQTTQEITVVIDALRCHRAGPQDRPHLTYNPMMEPPEDFLHDDGY